MNNRMVSIKPDRGSALGRENGKESRFPYKSSSGGEGGGSRGADRRGNGGAGAGAACGGPGFPPYLGGRISLSSPPRGSVRGAAAWLGLCSSRGKATTNKPR